MDDPSQVRPPAFVFGQPRNSAPAGSPGFGFEAPQPADARASESAPQSPPGPLAIQPPAFVFGASPPDAPSLSPGKASVAAAPPIKGGGAEFDFAPSGATFDGEHAAGSVFRFGLGVPASEKESAEPSSPGHTFAFSLPPPPQSAQGQPPRKVIKAARGNNRAGGSSSMTSPAHATFGAPSFASSPPPIGTSPPPPRVAESHKRQTAASAVAQTREELEEELEDEEDEEDDEEEEEDEEEDERRRAAIAAAFSERKILRARRTLGPDKSARKSASSSSTLSAQSQQPAGTASVAKMLLLCNGRAVPMNYGLVLKGFTPNGRYMLTHDRVKRRRRWYLWVESEKKAEGETNDSVRYDFVWKTKAAKNNRNADLELLCLTDRFVVFHSGFDETGCPLVAQYTLLDDHMRTVRDFSSGRGVVSLFTKADKQKVPLCGVPVARVLFSGIVDRDGEVCVVVTSGSGPSSYDLVSAMRITERGIEDAGYARHPSSTHGLTPDNVEIFSIPSDDAFVVSLVSAPHDPLRCLRYRFLPQGERGEITPGPLSRDQLAMLVSQRACAKSTNLYAGDAIVRHPQRDIAYAAAPPDPTAVYTFGFALQFGRVTTGDESDDDDEDDAEEEARPQEEEDEDDDDGGRSIGERFKRMNLWAGK